MTAIIRLLILLLAAAAFFSRGETLLRTETTTSIQRAEL